MLPHALTGDAVVQITDIGDVHLLRPLLRFLLHLEDFFLPGRKARKSRTEPCLLRQFQNKTLIVEFQVKVLHIPGMVCHITVKIIVIVTDTVNIHLGNPAEPKQFLLVIHMMTVEQVRTASSVLTERFQIGIFAFASLMHLCSDLIQKFPIQTCKSIHRKIIARSDRIVDLYFLNRVLACHIVDCSEQYKAGTFSCRLENPMWSLVVTNSTCTVTLDSLLKFPKPSIYRDQYDRRLCVFWYSSTISL